ncbi:hypothetical protein [Enterococcus caccae]|uniref:Uncharacterized protein n=1 Tax=Enterococcus caccae ATCC BAA-1240 TaxID=1158612 RepID=R3TMX7_9ENTE|nr:hypothetical protein [Enterococcus caccae]EOL42864.1 hypothetical protein UC7_03272 [Enterococcus caccae ATCC BAA-1240]EOT67657.1 hypothetical protein I580_00039 [Enterococcus caccae ATCC BAA-1240]
MKKIMLVVSGLLLFAPVICYGGDTFDSSVVSKFDASSDLTKRYARKQVLNGETTKRKKKNGEVYLEFPFDNSPYMSFSNFVLNGPTTVYSGFIETIFYRDKIKIRDMYYENNPVKTDQIGIFSTDLCFTSEEGVIYHYKNVPYLVSSDKPTVFFSKVDFNKDDAIISGEIKKPASLNSYQIELFYTDNNEYHYQETSADENGNFSIALNRDGIEGDMYLRSSDGLGNYANACDIDKQGKTNYSISTEDLKEIKASQQKIVNKETSIINMIKIIVWRFLVIIILILVLLRLRVILKRRKRRKMMKYK